MSQAGHPTCALHNVGFRKVTPWDPGGFCSFVTAASTVTGPLADSTLTTVSAQWLGNQFTRN